MYGIMNRYLSVLLLVNGMVFCACPGGAGGESAEGEGETSNAPRGPFDTFLSFYFPYSYSGGTTLYYKNM